MKRILFVFFICTISSTAWAQPKLYSISNEDIGVNSRVLSSTPVLDTLTKLPFVHDFFTLYYPIDSIANMDIPGFPGALIPIACTTQRFHGLIDKDSVEMTYDINDTDYPTLSARVKGKWYVDVIDKYTFELYKDIDLTDPLLRSNEKLPYARIKKIGAFITDIPDTLAFYNNNGGALVNTTSSYAINPVSYYCATFDGLTGKGVPYNTTNSLAVGYTDSLSSQAFDLTSKVPSDSLYMSFFYQNAGFGDIPDVTDRFELEFFASNSTWIPVWSKTGDASVLSDSFYLAMVVIKDPLFFHEGFRFRFKSYGRQSGTYDVWNLDYIYINSGRTISLPYDHRDLSISSVDESILKDYSAMPYEHFFANQSAFLKPSLSFKITNQTLENKTRQYQFYISDNYGNNIFNTTNTNISESKTWRESFSNPLSFTFSGIKKKPLYITQKYVILDNEGPDHKVPNNNAPFDCMFNNIVTRGTTLHDYYAYDDQTAEFAFGSNSSGSKIGVKFVSEKKDTLTHVDICFVQSKGGNLTGLKIYLAIWNSTRTIELRRQELTIKYTPFINGFNRFQLEEPLILEAGEVFYVGYIQNFSTLLTLGFDRNNDHTDKIFYNTNGAWKNLSNDPGVITGSLMIHPVFSKGKILTGVTDKTVAQKKTLELYPNPAQDYINIVHQDELNYQVFSLYGQVVTSGVLNTENRHQINIQQYSTGMYIILCTDKKNNTYTARFIKE